MHQNLALLGVLFLFLAYLAITEKRDELQLRWDSRAEPSNLSDFMQEDEHLLDYAESPNTLAI
jgi:hypothetical protein